MKVHHKDQTYQGMLNIAGGCCGNTPEHIAAIAKALELAYADMAEHQKHVQGLKTRMMNQLRERIPGVAFNGTAETEAESLYTVLNVCLPPNEQSGMLLFSLDLAQISASSGSACSSGSQLGSHVIKALDRDPDRPSVRFSFSKFNTAEEVDYVVNKLAEMYQPVEA